MNFQAEEIIHGALRAENVLVVLRGRTDFVVKASEVFENIYLNFQLGTIGLPFCEEEEIRWKSPELVRGEQNTKESDIWAYGT